MGIRHKSDLLIMKELALKIGAVGVIIVMAYAGWQFSRHVNYGMFYKAQVQQEIRQQLEPLNQRIAKLEAEVKTLQAK